MDRQFLLVASLSLCTLASVSADAQLSSASKQTQCKFQDHTDVTIEYDSMRMNGRKIFGGLVPFGKTWKTGDTRSPTFVTSANLVIGGKDLPAGNYSIATIPEKDTWTMIVQKMSGRGGQTEMEEASRIDLSVVHLHAPVEEFSISFDQVKSGCLLNLRWENTEASVLLAEKK